MHTRALTKQDQTTKKIIQKYIKEASEGALG